MAKPTAARIYEHVWSSDPALRRPAETDEAGTAAFNHALEMYRDTGDEAHLSPYLNGSEPMRFRLRDISGEAVAELVDRMLEGKSETRVAFRAVRHALVSVKGADMPVEHAKEDGFIMATDASVSQLFKEGYPGLIRELGNRILTEAQGRPKS